MEFELVIHDERNDTEQSHTSSTDSDQDSTFGNSTTSLHTSVKSFVTRYPYEHGRRYHAFKAGKYFVPNDKREQDRLELAHHVWQMMLPGGLYSRTVADGLGLSGHVSHQQLVARGTGLRALDAGTGTGMWAIDFADEYIDIGAQVVGNDLSPIQPRVSQIKSKYSSSS